MADIQAARLHLMQRARFPYLRSALLRLRDIVIDNDEIYAAVDTSWRLYYNKAKLDNLSLEATAGIVLHEVLHCLFAHADRYKSLSQVVPHVLWNIAADIAIWSFVKATAPDILAAVEKELPGIATAALFKLPEGKTAEEYLALLEKKAAYCTCTQHGAGSAGAKCDKCGKSTGDNPTKFGGSCSDGIRRPWEQAPDDEQSSPTNDTSREAIRRRVAEEMRQDKRLIGTEHAELSRFIEKFFPPSNRVARLISALRGAAASAGADGEWSSWDRPSRRYQSSDVFIPWTVNYRPEIRIILDSSGSMDADDFATAFSEIVGICRQIGNTVRVYSGDTDIGGIDVTDGRRVPKIVGGGGTDMGHVMRRVIERERLARSGRRTILVVITDGHTPWGCPPPRNIVPVVVLTRDTKPPTWARYVVRCHANE